MSNAARKFDSLEYSNELRKVGFSEEQANLQAKALFAVVEEQLLTKQDLKELEAKVSYGFQDMKRDIKESELRLLVRLPGIIAVVVGVISAVFKFLPAGHP